MNTINSAIEDKIIQLLSEIPDPEIPVVNIIELGMLKGSVRMNTELSLFN